MVVAVAVVIAGSSGRRRGSFGPDEGRRRARIESWLRARCHDRRGLDERLAEPARRLDPVGVARQDHPAGAIAVHLGMVDARGYHAAVTQRLGRVDHPPPRADDHRVRRPKMLLRAVDDRAHALRDRLVLLVDAGDAGEAPGALPLAVDAIVVVLVLRETEL